MFCFFHQLCAEAAAVGPAHIPATQLVDGRCIWLSSSVWSAERQFWDCWAMSRSMSLLPMVLLALGAWMLSALTSQSGFVMNSATPRGSKVAMRGFKDDFYAWKETLSSEDQALLLKQAQNASWQLSVLGLLPSLDAQRGTLLLCRPCMCSKLMFMDFMFSWKFHPSKYSMMAPTECCFFFSCPCCFQSVSRILLSPMPIVVIFSKEC